MNINTKEMTEDEMKEFLKQRARAEGIDLADPKNRYTIWSEGGPWSPEGKHVNPEGSAANVSDKELKIKASITRNGYSRTLVLDAVLDRIEIRLGDGKVTECLR
jgi:hypothetical protein